MSKCKLVYSRRYTKELVSLSRNGRVDTSELDKLLDLLSSGKPLDAKYGDHKLSKTSPKEYQGCREFHYRPNYCVVSKFEGNQLQPLRIEPHNRLGLTEGTACSKLF